VRDYSMRSGWPAAVAAMRGAALADFSPPADMAVPQALRPWPHPGRTSADAGPAFSERPA
jgi:hypothetical protein